MQHTLMLRDLVELQLVPEKVMDSASKLEVWYKGATAPCLPGTSAACMWASLVPHC